MTSSIYEDALNYSCRRCKAAKGQPCTSPSGRRALRPHNERVALVPIPKRPTLRALTFAEVLDDLMRDDDNPITIITL